MGLASILLFYFIQQGFNPYVMPGVVILSIGFVVMLLEKILPFEKQWLSGTDWNLDFLYYFINYGIKVFAEITFIWYAGSFAVVQLFPTQLPFWIQAFLALAIIDFFLFFVHYLSHKYEWLWKLHAIHHSSERLYFLNGEKRHALHQVLEGFPGIVLCLLIGTPQPVLVAALAFLAINMFMQHTNLDYKAGVFRYFFCVAELHRWHHRADYKDAQVNFGGWLTIWDKIFGTLYYNPNLKQELGEIGIKEEPNFPKSYLKQFIYPFSKSIQKLAKGIFILIFLLFSSTIGIAQIEEGSIEGDWQNENKSRIVNMYKNKGRLFAKIVEDDNKENTGKVIIRGLKFNKRNKEWSGGKLQLPGMTHPVKCYIKFEDENKIKIVGYHGIRLLGESKVYYRLN